MHKRITTVVILLLTLLLVVAAAVIVWLAGRRPEPVQNEPEVVALKPDPAEQPVTDGIQIPGYTLLAVDADTGAVDTVFENPEGNPCTFQLTLTRTDTGEILWESGAFQPGTGIQNPRLTVIPPPGRYEAVLSYTTRSIEDDGPMNGAVINLELDVQ